MNRQLLRIARHRIAEGDLPDGRHARAYGGSSRGGNCALCGERIEVRTSDIELVCSGDDGERTITLMHPVCHAAWLTVARSQETKRPVPVLPLAIAPA